MDKNRKLALLLAFALTISALPGCKDQEGMDELDKPNDDFIEETITERENSIEPTDYDAIMTRLSMVGMLYENEEAFFPKEEIQDYMRLAETTQTCDNEDLDYTTLADKIIKNSIYGVKYYVKKEFCPFLKYPEDYDEDSEEWKIDNEFRTALRKAVDIAFENSDVQPDDICRMKDLMIAYAGEVEGNGTTWYYDLEKNILTIDKEGFEKDYKRNCLSCAINGQEIWTRQDYFVKQLASFLNIYRKGICNCRLEKGQEYGALESSDKHVFLSLLYGNAEAQIMRSRAFEGTSISQYNFPLTIQNEGLLLMLACFKEDKSLGDYSSALNDSNFQKLFDFFEITEDNIEWFYRIVTALDTGAGWNKAGLDVDDEMTVGDWLANTATITNPAKIDILNSTTKDLIASICKYGDFTKDEADTLFKFLKANLLSQFSITYTSNEEFETAVDGIDDTFYDFLATYYGLSNEELETLRAMPLEPSVEELNVNDTTFTYERTSDSRIDFRKLRTRYPLMMEIWYILHGSQNDLTNFARRKTVPSKTINLEKAEN